MRVPGVTPMAGKTADLYLLPGYGTIRIVHFINYFYSMMQGIDIQPA